MLSLRANLASAALLLAAALAATGCSDTDPENTELVGVWQAANPAKTYLGSKRLKFTDAHHVVLDDGKTYTYSHPDGGEWHIDHSEAGGSDTIFVQENQIRVEIVQFDSVTKIIYNRAN